MPSFNDRVDAILAPRRQANAQATLDRQGKDRQRKESGRQQLSLLSQAGGLGKGVAHQQQTRNALLGQMSGGVQQPVNEQARAQAQSRDSYGPPTPEQHMQGMMLGPPQAPQGQQAPQSVAPSPEFQLLQRSRTTGLAPQALLAQDQQATQNQIANQQGRIANQRGRIENDNLSQAPGLTREKMASDERRERTRAETQQSVAETQADASKFVATENKLANLGVASTQLTGLLAQVDGNRAVAEIARMGAFERQKLMSDVQKAGQEMQYKAAAMGVLSQDIKSVAEGLSAAIQSGNVQMIESMTRRFNALLQMSSVNTGTATGALKPVPSQGAASRSPLAPQGPVDAPITSNEVGSVLPNAVGQAVGDALFSPVTAPFQKFLLDQLAANRRQ